MDFHKFFHSIDHEIVKKLIRRVLQDEYALWLMDTVIDSYPTGIPIGALTSQLMANIVGDALDHHICDQCGCRFYTRYMDDVIIVSNSYEHLQCVFAEARRFSEDVLYLTLNENKSHIAIAEYRYGDGKVFDPGIDFAGYGIHRNHLVPRRRNVKAAKKRFRKLARLVDEGMIPPDKLNASFQSYLGYMKHCIWTKHAYTAIKLELLWRPYGNRTA